MYQIRMAVSGQRKNKNFTINEGETWKTVNCSSVSMLRVLTEKTTRLDT